MASLSILYPCVGFGASGFKKLLRLVWFTTPHWLHVCCVVGSIQPDVGLSKLAPHSEQGLARIGVPGGHALHGFEWCVLARLPGPEVGMVMDGDLLGARLLRLGEHVVRGCPDLIDRHRGVDPDAVKPGIVEHGPAFAAWADYLGATDDDLEERFEEAYRGEWESVQAYAQELVDDLGVRIQVDPPSWGHYVSFDTEALARDLEYDLHVADTAHGGVYLFETGV